MRRRWIALLSAAVLFFFSTAAARAEIAPTAAVPEQQQWTASASATAAAAASSSQLSSSSSSTSSRPRPSLALATTPKSHRRLLRCDSHSMVSASAKVLSDPKGNRGRADLFRSLNSTAFSVSTEGAINDRCSQADPIIDASSTEPLENRLVIHERPWTEKEIINTALRRRGVRVAAGVLTEYDLAAASPLLLPSLIRFRPLSDVLLGNEVSRVMDVFSDGEIPANSTINGLPRSVERLETVVASASGALMRRTISPRGLREMLSRPELVLLAMAAANRTLAPGTDNAAKNLRITKDEYRAFLMRDADVEICRDRRVLVGDVFAPVDRLFAAADTDNDGRLDASEIRRSNLTDAATVWILAGDTDGDGMLSAQELANGLPQFRDLQPRSGMQRALPEHLRRIRETAGLAAVASYDVDKDGRLALEEMRVHSSDFTRRSMGQTMVPVWALSWHVALISVHITRREAATLRQEQKASRLTDWEVVKASKAASEQLEQKGRQQENSNKEPAEAFPSLFAPQDAAASASSNFTSFVYDQPTVDDSAALRSFMISQANFTMSARAALAAAAAAGMSYASGSASDLSAGFDVWSRGANHELTQKEWVDFFATVHSTGARAYWTIGKRAGPGAVTPECCGVLAPGLVEIAKVIPQHWGASPIALPVERAEADAVRFDCDGDGIKAPALPIPVRGGSSDDKGTATYSAATAEGRDEAALTYMDLLQWGILRLGVFCDVLAPVNAMTG